MRVLISLLVVVAFAPGGGAPVVEHPFTGVTHITRHETSPRSVRMHIVSIDLTAPGIRFKVTPPSGPRETIRQTTLQFLEAEGAQVAINAHFFLPWPSWNPFASLVGLAASDGLVYSGFEEPEQSYAIVAEAPAINIDAGNRATLVHSRPGDPPTDVTEAVTLWNVVAGSAQIVTDGVKTVPVYADGSHPGAALRPGLDYSNARSWYEQLNARTAIGLTNRGRTLVLFTVDRASGSLGMSVGEVADLLIRDYKVEQALNLDGGGSTTLAMQDPETRAYAIVNASSDNSSGRAVGSSLAIFARVR